MSATSSSRKSRVVESLIGSDRFQEAYEHCRPLAEADDAEAQMYVGWMHHVGKGTARNLDEAERWYRRALKTQSPRVEFFLASIYWEKGQRDQVREWLERAATKGFPPALYELGRLYRFGHGVAVDRQKSRSYYEEAARLGHVFARRHLAGEICKGRRGLWRVPVGFFMLVSTVATIVRVGWKNPPHDLVLRVDGLPLVPRL